MSSKFTSVHQLIGKTIFSQRGLAGERAYVVDSAGFDSGFFWISATEIGGSQVQQMKSTSLDGLAVKVLEAGK